ncbi:TPA: protein-export chaperone SecB [Vibrio vulnificus]|uniref:protein-export chaperone SecB n=1 Tax=Vibrio vulnificus TaxID=672 RepID=UPI0004F7EB94|nr:protein-export chaperone SecB [Vibrio vulnificus]AIL72861.1 preprotein translocase subunit SecB [Vibrio vulnificus]MCA0765649.1 protein-export chaperone SecB [Vibrio vulnificus]MCU8123053.1 protein-export chaperone SecB [Vibrio vulnificus]MCU8302204.1 protein-export chaperone SecB [Vibrio vulnificus]MDK2639573.1 protein-export chaperone SecB [Vibrio vulnificus]
MKIQLKSTRVDTLNLEHDDSITKDEFSLSFADGYSSNEEDKSFIIKFDIKVESKQGYFLDLGFVAVFETNEPPHEEFKNSHFTNVNAPAIAYPYMRSFVSMLTLNSGYEPMILPTVNFQAMANRDCE